MRTGVPRILVAWLLSVAAIPAGGAQAGMLDGMQQMRPRRAVYVDGDYLGANGPSDGSRHRPFSTIQQATALAEAVSTITEIHVDRSADPYVGPVKIERSDLALVGDNWNDPVFPRPRIARSPRPAGATIRVTAGLANVLLQGFEVELGAAAGGTPNGIAIRVAAGSADITMRNLTVTGANPDARSYTLGILVKASSRVTIEHCLFADIDHWYPKDVKYIRPIRIEDSFDSVVQNCEFTRIGEMTDDFSFIHVFRGIELVGGSGHTVRNNLFHDLVFLPHDSNGQGADPNTTSGDIAMIDGQDSEYVTVVNNTMANIDARGIQTVNSLKNLRWIYVTDTQHADIRNNLIAYVDWVPGGPDSFFCHFHFCPGINPCDPNEPPVVDYSAVTRDWEDDYFPDSMEGIGTLSLATDESAEPVFVDRANGDYRLAPDSRCVDAGDPAIADPDGSLSDLGCYGGPRGNLPVGILRPTAEPTTVH